MTIAIDLFAGLGGWTEGATQAGIRVVWAANHWPVAVAAHAANHPETMHACQDLQQARWCDVPRHDVLLASPSCTGHTAARGTDRPHHDAARATAWAVVSCAEVHRPPVVVVENVPEFCKWVLYPAWTTAMEALGYKLAPHLLDAADFGIAQNRERVYIVATRTKKPLRLWFEREPVALARDLIRWDAHPWQDIHRPGRSPWTIRQVEHGRSLGLDSFLLPYYGGARKGSSPSIRRLDRPLGTITTVDRWGLVRGDKMRMLQPHDELRDGMSFRADYVLPDDRKDAVKLLGNAVCPKLTATLLRKLVATA